MVSFNESQLVFLNTFFEICEFEDGVAKLEEFNKTYKRPVKRIEPVDDSARCQALTRSRQQCKNRRMGAQLCVAHSTKGTPFGTKDATDRDVLEAFGNLTLGNDTPDTPRMPDPPHMPDTPDTPRMPIAQFVIKEKEEPVTEEPTAVDEIEPPMSIERVNEMIDAFFD